MGRTVRTAKYGEKTDTNGTHTLGWNVSGAVQYDAKGRTVQEGQTYFSTALTASSLISETPKLVRPTEQLYDGLDRVIQTVLPDGSIQTNDYGVDSDCAYTLFTDAKGNRTRTESDVRGNIKHLIKYDSTGSILTRGDYEYNVLGELCTAYDAQQNAITVEYDMLGRRTSLESADNGRKEYVYDECGNVVEESDSLLRAEGVSIAYTYDGLNRLTEIDYPFSTDIVYYYGEPGADENGAGRIVRLTDETGMTTRSYGLLGEVVEESRTIGEYSRIWQTEHTSSSSLSSSRQYFTGGYYRSWFEWLISYVYGRRPTGWYYRHHHHGKYGHHLPWYGSTPSYEGAEYSDGSYTSTMSYTSDYLGRMAYITYPDGETLSYSYDKGGQVVSATGVRNGFTTEYVKDIGYDEYGQRTYIEYGNGTHTRLRV